jgi:Predicted redox protein, regulator of disulfide bond formation
VQKLAPIRAYLKYTYGLWFVKIVKDKDKYVLDARGYACPYPQIFAIKTIKEVEPGSIMEILVDNPASCDNVPAAIRNLAMMSLGLRMRVVIGGL